MDMELVPPWNYLPGLRSKKKSIQVRYAIACCLGFTLWSVEWRKWRIEMGSGQN